MDSLLRPEEYEMDIKALKQRLKDYLEKNEGKEQELMDECEKVVALREEFPEVYARHPELEGLIADMLARRQQKKFRADESVTNDSPGCLLGWLFGGGGS
jgi:hypothetical protein